ncbi:hypothetical protein C8J98_101380 [Luteibacter sp. OK325]|nr:hypothetical protein C8J98_101380 [Luteibacter sp. OK325]
MSERVIALVVIFSYREICLSTISNGALMDQFICLSIWSEPGSRLHLDFDDVLALRSTLTHEQGIIRVFRRNFISSEKDPSGRIRLDYSGCLDLSSSCCICIVEQGSRALDDVLGYLSNTVRCIARFLTFSQGCDAYGSHGHVASTCACTLVSHLTD